MKSWANKKFVSIILPVGVVNLHGRYIEKKNLVLNVTEMLLKWTATSHDLNTV